MSTSAKKLLKEYEQALKEEKKAVKEAFQKTVEPVSSKRTKLVRPLFTCIGGRCGIFLSDLIIMFMAAIIFVLGFFTIIGTLNFVFSATLLATLLIRTNLAKITAVTAIMATYMILLFTSLWINPTDILWLLLGVNTFSKWMTLVASIVIFGVYFVGLVAGIAGYCEKTMILSSISILGISLGCALFDLFGNVYVFHQISIANLTLHFILDFTGYFSAVIIAFVVFFIGGLILSESFRSIVKMKIEA